MSEKISSIVSAVITVILIILIGVATLFMELIILNGFGEREGTAALSSSVVCQGIGLILGAILAGWLSKLLIKKYDWNKIGAMAIAILAGAVLGAGSGVASIFLGMIVAEAVR
jgi:hypothetical protein